MASSGPVQERKLSIDLVERLTCRAGVAVAAAGPHDTQNQVPRATVSHRCVFLLVNLILPDCIAFFHKAGKISVLTYKCQLSHGLKVQVSPGALGMSEAILGVQCGVLGQSESGFSLTRPSLVPASDVSPGFQVF